MKVLVFVTGRGTGGDAVIAYIISKTLEKHGISTKIVLDPSAPGYYYKKRNVEWLKSPIPNAGGHAASKSKLFKATIRTFRATISGARLIRKEDADGVVGVIGGGAIIGSTSARIARVPSVTFVSTPTDTKVSLRLSNTLVSPESSLYFESDIKSKNPVEKVYIPIKTDIIKGNKDNIKDVLPEQYNKENPSVLFSSGSTLFDDMAKAARKYAEENDNVNIFVIGDPLKEELNDILDHPNIINLGYINYVSDLYDLIDLAVITDDGVTIHETIACGIPVVIVKGVKYGRYHNLASIFDGAVLESDVDNITDVVNDALDNSEQMNLATKKYAEDIINTSEHIAELIINFLSK